MSTTQADISKSFNIQLVRVTAGVYWSASLRRIVGVKPIPRKASTGVAKETVQSTPITVHKWASRVGMYNDDPIWGEIFQNVRKSRKRR